MTLPATRVRVIGQTQEYLGKMALLGKAGGGYPVLEVKKAMISQIDLPEESSSTLLAGIFFCGLLRYNQRLVL